MRCTNCGWMNPEGLTTCQKCNQPLVFTPIQNNDAVANPRATMISTQEPIVNPRATMLSAQDPIINPRATMMSTQEPAPNPRATMISTPVANPRATMLATQQPIEDPRATMITTQEVVKAESPVFHLYCMDAEIGDLQITAPAELGLAKGDIVFIKNLRYQVK